MDKIKCHGCEKNFTRDEPFYVISMFKKVINESFNVKGELVHTSESLKAIQKTTYVPKTRERNDVYYCEEHLPESIRSHFKKE